MDLFEASPLVIQLRRTSSCSPTHNRVPSRECERKGTTINSAVMSIMKKRRGEKRGRGIRSVLFSLSQRFAAKRCLGQWEVLTHG